MKIDQGIPLNDVWCYNISTNIWFELILSNPSIVEARFCHSANIIGEKIYIFGGILF